MALKLPPIPTDPIGETASWRQWFYRIGESIANPVSTIFHNLLGGLQGGKAGEYFHLTNNQVNVLGGSGSDKPYLTPPAGTIASGTAPLKFTAGPLMTVEESGAMEYYDDHLYFTDGGRHAFVLSDVPITSTTTVANTTTETTLFTYNIEANELHDDEVMKFELSGFYSTASASETFYIKFYIDSTLLATVTNVKGKMTNQGWKSTYELTTYSTGTSGTIMDFADYIDSAGYICEPGLTTTTFDTTIPHSFTVTITWGAAKTGNTITITQGRLTFVH